MVQILVFAAVALSLTATSFVRGDNTPSPVPEDSQIGLLHFPVTCELAYSLNQTFETIFSATAPVFGGTGEEIYYTDVVGDIIIPHYITGLAPLVNAQQASANVTVYLSLTNASPANLLVYKATINNISFANGADAHIRIPPGNDTLPPLGPVTLGAANTAHRIFLGNVEVDVELQDAKGNNAFGPIPVVCGKQDVDFVIGSIDINSTTGLAPYSPANGYVPVFPDTPMLYESGSFRFPYDCNFGALGPQTVDLEISGTIPTNLKPGQSFSLTNSDSFLRLPPSLVNLAKQAYPNVTTFDTLVNEFDILFSNASPEVYNVAKTQIESSIDVTGNAADLVIPIPKNGYLTVGPITAGADGTIIGVAVGNATANAVLRDADGGALLELDISCAPPAPLELIGVPITNKSPGNYSLGTAITSTAAASGGSTSVAATTTSSGGFSIPTFA